MKVFFWGKKSAEYRGWDSVTDKNVHVKRGNAIDVSEKKGEQLLRDYSGEFELVPKGAAQEKETPEAASVDTVLEEEKESKSKGRKKKNG